MACTTVCFSFRMMVGIQVSVAVRLSFGKSYQTISPESCIVISLDKFDF